MSKVFPKRPIPTHWVSEMYVSWESTIMTASAGAFFGEATGNFVGAVEHPLEVLYVFSNDFSEVSFIIGFYDDGVYSTRTDFEIELYKSEEDRRIGSDDRILYTINIPTETERKRYTIMTEPKSFYKKEDPYIYGRIRSCSTTKEEGQLKLVGSGKWYHFEITPQEGADTFRSFPDIISPRLYNYEASSSNIHWLLRAVAKPFDYLMEKYKNLTTPNEFSGALHSLGWFWNADELSEAEKLRLALKIIKLYKEKKIPDIRYTANKSLINAVLEVIAGMYYTDAMWKNFVPPELGTDLAVLDDDKCYIFAKRDELTYLFVINMFAGVTETKTVYNYLRRLLPAEIAAVVYSHK